MRHFDVLAAAVLLTLVPTLAQAQSPSFAARDPSWGAEERDLGFTYDFAGFTITSSRNSTAAQDNWTLQFDARAALLRLTANGTRPDGATGTALSVRLRSLVEFQDLDGDGRLGLGDPVLQQLLFAEGSSGWIETVRRADGSLEPVAHYWLKGARVDVQFHPTRNGTIGSGGSPVATPFDVAVSSFPYLSDNRTYLALELRVESPVAVVGDALGTMDGPLRSFLAWSAPRADGNATALGVTMQRYLGQPAPQWLLTVSQPRDTVAPLSLVLGVARVPPSDTIPEILRQISGDWRFYMLGLLVAGLVVGWPIYRRMQTVEERP